MGFFDALSTVTDRLAGAATGFLTGGPAGALLGAAGVERAKRQEKALERAEYMAIQNFQTPLDNFAGAQAPVTAVNTPGFFAPGGVLRTSVRDFGGFLSDFSPIASVFGLGSRFQNVPPAGAETIISAPPQETAMSGEIAGANLGVGTGLVQAARGLARSPAGQALFGGGVGIGVGSLMDGANGKPRITRRMKSDVRKIYGMAGMDPNATAQILNNLGTYPRINFDANVVFFILTKRFRNDGPVVTKAAVRKTKTTLRRMKGVVDMYNSVCKPTTRRAPTRRAAPKAVQLIKN